MIALDLDGTLLSPAGQVTLRSKAAIHRALHADLLVCFATGRNWTESQDILDALNHYPTAVFVGGAMVVDTHQRVTLHRTMMQPDLAIDVCRLLEQTGHSVLALADLGEEGVEYLIGDRVPPNHATEAWMAITNARVTRLPSLADHPHKRTIRLGICASSSEVSEVTKALEDRFGGRIVFHNLQVPAFGVEVMEIFDPAVNKWEGILHIARRHEITPEQIVAIGDDLNDLPMIRNAGLGVAMGNALPEVKAAAGRVIGSNREDGLADFLNELVDRHIVEPVPEQ
jgi:Cof subfamily protein (haloacid dehalogenase superfamily)